jgi:Arc/MetJ-type ribon-helix-helix transcriptional regulator
LAHLVELTGRNRSEVVRDAIRAAEREAVLARLREQAKQVREDPDDRAEMLGLADELEQLRAW